MVEGSLPDEWYCNVCVAERRPRAKEEEGGFGPILAMLERKNPSAFRLPKDIREYFEGVKTGTEGEYEEGVAQKPKNRAGYDESPDYFKLKDSKGNFILCHQCHQPAVVPNRMVIPCSYCTLSWHLDCLEPPLTKEPPAGKMWKCPCHVDDLLAQVPGSLGPAHRFRRIKGASVIKPAVSRGIKNNGYIEIENALSDDEEQGFYEQREYGHVYKLPEDGIKLDFISQIRRKTGAGHAPRRPTVVIKSQPSQQPHPSFNDRSVIEQQAALNLAQLVMQNPDDSVSNTQALVDALIAEAPPEVITMIAQGDASDIAVNALTKRDKQSLLALKAFIESKLSRFESEPEQPEQQEEQAEEKTKEVATDEDVEMEL